VNIALQHHDAASFAAPLLAVFAVDTAEGSDTPVPALLTSSGTIADAARTWLSSGEFKAGLGETLLLHAPAGLAASRLLLIGLGKANVLSSHQLRKGAGAAVRFCKPRGLRELAIAFPENSTLPLGLAARALAEGSLLADFEIDIYRSDRKDLSVHAVTVLHNSHNPIIPAGFQEGVIFGESQNLARSLVNEPGNVLTPRELGKRAAAMCAEVGLACEVHSTEKLEELGMGAFLAVTQGSVQPPALIVMRYYPEYIEPGTPTFGLVGKGITFDTGGISIKPGDNMEKMKYDMAGAAAMIGAMRAIALLKPAVPVIGIVCSCENMPDGKAYKPGDVVTAMSGKTIEIINTDAEGRLVLADGLHYARTLGATHLINAATLTGAIGVALGLLNAGLFSNDDATAQRFMDILSTTGEKYWRMPCTDDYRDQIKSQRADIRNTGATRYGGATTAAMFLKEFVGEYPSLPAANWIHLDIAGTAWSDSDEPWISKGPTGTAVRSIAEWVRSYAR
jgi:leucyl aminopeptidase